MQEKEEKTEKIQRRKIDDNIIYIGDKPFTNYAMTLFTQLTRKEHKEVKVIARGNFITRAVDVVEFAKRRFSEGENKIKEISIETGSEKFKKKDKEGREKDINVSVIEITIKK